MRYRNASLFLFDILGQGCLLLCYRFKSVFIRVKKPGLLPGLMNNYLTVPNVRSPQSPRPGQIYAFSFRHLSSAPI